MYHTVYSPDGEMFEVTRHVFEDVVLNKGWTQTKPVAETKAIKEPIKVSKAKPVQVAKAKVVEKSDEKSDD